ncbi:phosphoribosyltransferase [Devosia sp. A449]
MTRVGPPFADRREAGRQLAQAVAALQLHDPLVVALPRGGVPVAFEVARVLGAPLELLLVRKIGAPGHAEYGLGAVVDGDPPQLVLDDAIMRVIDPPAGYVEAQAGRAIAELARRRQLYLGQRPALTVRNRTVILVDDGIATGVTITAALTGMRNNAVARIILAIPVAPADVLDTLRPKVDAIVCLSTPEPFNAVGLHYAAFPQVADQEVVALLRAAE